MMNKKIFIIILCMIIVLTVFVGAAGKIMKDDIHIATKQELVKVDDIGDVLSERIVLYLKHNKDCSIEDLVHVKGIGEQRLKEIKKSYY